jgi:hypothetical protein
MNWVDEIEKRCALAESTYNALPEMVSVFKDHELIKAHEDAAFEFTSRCRYDVPKLIAAVKVLSESMNRIENESLSNVAAIIVREALAQVEAIGGDK